ncbi:MAG TPA: hypothetical protein VLM79_36705 [Kofleriaceae bacterium]|nr:hypothetical protein [Kofleriaceae bacterium]
MTGQLNPNLSTPLLTPSQAAVLLDQVIYEQVLSCIDLDELYRVGHSLTSMIDELDGIPEDRVGDLARSILDRAILRLPDDLRGYLRVSELAAHDACFLCEEEARQRHAADGPVVTAAGSHRRTKRPIS